jgi:hypothetical protein
MGMAFIPIAILFALPTLLYSPPSVHPPVVRENPEIHVRYFRNWLVSLMPWLARPTRNMEASFTLKTMVPFFAPMKNRLFRRLLLVFIVNGSALGVAVSVMLFYVEHVLKAAKLQAGVILLSSAPPPPACRCGYLCALQPRPPPGSSPWYDGRCDVARRLPGREDSSGSCRSRSSPGSASAPTTACHRRSWPTSSIPRKARTRAATPAPISACGRCRPSSRRRWRGRFAAGCRHAGLQPQQGNYSGTALILVYIAVPVVIKIVAALLIWFIKIEAERGSVRDELMGRA